MKAQTKPDKERWHTDTLSVRSERNPHKKDGRRRDDQVHYANIYGNQYLGTINTDDIGFFADVGMEYLINQGYYLAAMMYLHAFYGNGQSLNNSGPIMAYAKELYRMSKAVNKDCIIKNILECEYAGIQEFCRERYHNF